MSTAPVPAETTPVTAAAKPRAASAGRTTAKAILFVLLSRVLGVARSMAVAHVFGQNAATDIYNRAFAVPDMMYLLLAGGALSAVFIPVFTDYLHKGEEGEAWRTFSRVTTLVALGAALLVAAAELLAYPLSRFAALSFSESAVREMVPLTRVLLPSQWFFFVGGLFIAALQARDRWLFPNLAPLVYNAGIIAGALLFGHRYGPVALTVGAVAGAFVGNFLLPLIDLLRSGARFRPALDWKHPGVVRFGQLLLPAMLGLGLSQLAFLLTGFFLGEGGALTALKNGYELTQAPIGIFAQASAIVLFPAIARLAAAQDWPAFRDEVHHGIRRILYLTVPASLLMAVLAEPIITLLYAGKKFGPPQIADAALALRLYSLGTFAWSAQAVLGRGFFALQDTKTPLSITKWMALLLVGLFSVGTYVLHLGFAGLALSMSLVGTLNMVLLLAALSRRLGGLDVRGIAVAAARIALAALLASGVAWAAVRILADRLPHTRPASLLALILGGGLGLGVYVGASVLLRIPELRSVRAMLRPARPAANQGVIS